MNSIKKTLVSKELTQVLGEDGAEKLREAAELMTEVTGFECQRNLSAGIPGDVGDLHGIPNTVIQVCDWADKNSACLVKPREVEVQKENAGVDFVGTMVRFRGGKWRIVLTPEQFNTLLQAALH